MSRLDDELRTAFQRREPSGDFADRVVARIRLQQTIQQAETPSWWRPLLAYLSPFQIRRGQFRLAVAGALVCVIVATVGVHSYRERQKDRAEGEIARAQVIFALQIASAKLNVAQKKVRLLTEESPAAGERAN